MEQGESSWRLKTWSKKPGASVEQAWLFEEFSLETGQKLGKAEGAKSIFSGVVGSQQEAF